MGKDDGQALLGHVAVCLSGSGVSVSAGVMLGLAWQPHFSFSLVLSSLFSCFFHLPRRGHAGGQAKALEGPGKPQGQVSHGEWVLFCLVCFLCETRVENAHSSLREAKSWR